MSAPVVGVRAVGLCTPLGRDLDELWERIARGEDGFVEVDRFELPGLPTRWASAFDGPAIEALCAEAGESDPAVAFAVLAARDATVGLSAAARATVALVVATSAGAAETHDAYDKARGDGTLMGPHLVEGGAFASFAGAVARGAGLAGPRTAVSTACASGGHALGLAIDLVRSGDAERVLVVGADSVHRSLFSGFHSVGALASEPCAPFGERFGMSLGEGAGALLLEADPEAPLAVFLGWGGSCDAYHATAPDPQGAGMARGLESALVDAGLEAAEVGAFNAHGTGTEANDPAETFAVQAVFGPGVPVSASKSQLGHTQGAAGVLEAIVALAGLRAQALPPSVRSEPHRRIAPEDTVGDRARPASYDTVVSHSAAFGGTNVAVVLGREPRVRAGAHGPIFAMGTGSSAPFGPVGSALDPEARAVDHRPAHVRARRADPISAVLTRAVAAATSDAGISGPDDGAAMVVGMADGPQLSIRRFVDSRDARGLASASAAAFARMVFNAPAGVAAATLQLRGPNLTLWSGHGAGAQAVIFGARLLREHPSLTSVVAAGADEVGHISEDRLALGLSRGTPIEAGAAVVLGRRREGAVAALAGAAWGPPGDPAEVVARACGGRTPDRAIWTAPNPSVIPRGAWDLDGLLGLAPAASGALASCAAVDWIRTEGARTVLVVSVAGESGCSALLWTAPEDVG